MSAPDRTLCVGIDLDDLRYYRGIHALPPRDEGPLVFTAAVPRFLEVCRRAGVPATLFVIGEDCRWPEAGEALRAAVAAGHEVASHSLTHPYDLSRRSRDAIESELAGAREAIEAAAGAPVAGFRAPGYNLTPALLAAINRTGHRYDSSILPSPGYWAARAAVIATMHVRGRRSTSIVGRARDFMRGRAPFTWGGEAAGLREVPMTACGPLRAPLIGTFLAGGRLARHLVACAARLPLVNVEFHAIDFLGDQADDVEPGLRVEPVLRVPLAERLAAFESALTVLAEGRRVATLAQLCY